VHYKWFSWKMIVSITSLYKLATCIVMEIDDTQLQTCSK